MTFDLNSRLHRTILLMALLRYGVSLDPVTTSTGELVRAFMDNFANDKIKAIKYVRQSCDYHLKESKEFVESVYAKAERVYFLEDVKRLRFDVQRITVGTTEGYELRNSILESIDKVEQTIA